MLTSTIENVLNRGLPRSPRARALCRELAGRRMGVDVRGMTRLLVESTGETLKITRDAVGEADAEVSGAPFSLLALAGESPDAVVQRGDVEIRGDAALAQKYRELAMLLKPDVEEELSLAVGDVAAHQIGRAARAVFSFGRRAASTTVQNVAEFLAHERADLVPRAEGDQLLKGVDALREDVDRAEARIARVRGRLGS
jgi:ubiquinone biosynthesis accessory factor UbiJ